MEQLIEYKHWLHVTGELQFLVSNLDNAAEWCGWWQWWVLHPDSVVRKVMLHKDPAQADYYD